MNEIRPATPSGKDGPKWVAGSGHAVELVGGAAMIAWASCRAVSGFRIASSAFSSWMTISALWCPSRY
jgi:hypothetical protein